MKDLVCLHAGASGPATWDRFVPEFERLGYRVRRPVLLGHAGAERRRPYRLVDFRDQVLREIDGLERVTFVGNSLGAYVAAAVAGAVPDRIERLVLEEMPVPPQNEQDGSPTTRAMPGAALLVAGWLARRKCDPRLLRDVIGELRQPQPQWWHGLTGVRAPALLLAGGDASHLDQSRFGLLAGRMPSATVVTIPAGHRIHTWQPERWLTTVRDFLAFKRA